MGAMGLLLVVAAMVFVGATVPRSTDYSESDFQFRSVTTQRVTMVDEDGTARAMLSQGVMGPMFVLLDEQGRSRLWLYLGDVGPAVVLNDERGMNRATLAIVQDVPQAILANARGDVIWRAPR